MTKMLQPRLAEIHIATASGLPMTRLESCRVIPGAGIEGDRYATRAGTWSSWPKDHEITLVEAEVCAELVAAGLNIFAGDLRRNLVTRDVRLNNLIDRKFAIGEVQLRGTRLCEPCKYLKQLLGVRKLAKLLASHGGLQARILTEGIIHAGDKLHLETVAPVTPSL